MTFLAVLLSLVAIDVFVRKEKSVAISLYRHFQNKKESQKKFSGMS